MRHGQHNSKNRPTLHYNIQICPITSQTTHNSRIKMISILPIPWTKTSKKNYALYIQISKSTTSQTIHKNLIEIIQKNCLPFTKKIKDFENSTFKFLELPFHNPFKEKKKKR
jgi:hypothetical protein